jgi:hypothetical protein
MGGSLLFLLLAVGGCGPETSPTAKVHGKVTYQGKPVPNVSVTFTPATGRPAFGTTDANGEYKLSTFGEEDGAEPGMHTVTLASTAEIPMPGTPEAAQAANQPPPFPPKYSDAATSGLSKEVKKGEDNEINLDLTD